MALTHSPAIITEGLVLHLDAGNPRSYPRSGTAWRDLSRRGNDGTLTNGPTFSTANGGGVVFDGTNDHVKFNSLPPGFQAGITNYSISIWFKLNTSKEGALLEMGTSSSEYQRIMFWLTGGTPNRLYALGASNNNYRYSSISLNTTSIFNGVYTYNHTGTISKLYINSIEDTGLTNSTTHGLLTNLGNSWTIGADSVYGQTYCQTANIYNVMLYTKTLSAVEIQQNFNATRARYNV